MSRNADSPIRRESVPLMEAPTEMTRHDSLTDLNRTVLRLGVNHVIKLFIPVSICMLFVVATINLVKMYKIKDLYMLYTPFHETSSEPITKIWNAIGNSLILISIVIVMTILLFALYKYKFYKCIHGWLMMSSLAFLSIHNVIYINDILYTYNVPMDYITFFFVLWNFGILGLVNIHWKGPLLLHQSYLIFIAALLALNFINYMPEWTTWFVLFTISIWDLIAVLTPRGPLKKLVELAGERNEELFPAMVYSSTVVYLMSHMNSVSSATEEEEEEERHESTTEEIRRLVEQAENGGFKLGLGDFIFYSVLVGKASSYGDWNTTLACFVAILIGLCLTLLLLSVFKQVLPALPISIIFGLIFYITTRVMITPFVDILVSQQVFV